MMMLPPILHDPKYRNMWEFDKDPQRLLRAKPNAPEELVRAIEKFEEDVANRTTNDNGDIVQP